MDTKTYETLAKMAESLMEYEGLADELRSIARFIAEPRHKKRLEQIAKFLEREVPESFFNGAKNTAYQVIHVLASESYLSDEEVAAKIGKSASTVRQTVGALKGGGVEFEESHSKGFRLKGKRGYGKRRAISLKD